MKRVTALIAALAVPAILLVGCGGDDSADSGSKSDSRALLSFPWVAGLGIRGCTPSRSYVSGRLIWSRRRRRGARGNDMASGARLG